MHAVPLLNALPEHETNLYVPKSHNQPQPQNCRTSMIHKKGSIDNHDFQNNGYAHSCKINSTKDNPQYQILYLLPSIFFIYIKKINYYYYFLNNIFLSIISLIIYYFYFILFSLCNNYLRIILIIFFIFFKKMTLKKK